MDLRVLNPVLISSYYIINTLHCKNSLAQQCEAGIACQEVSPCSPATLVVASGYPSGGKLGNKYHGYEWHGDLHTTNWKDALSIPSCHCDFVKAFGQDSNIVDVSDSTEGELCSVQIKVQLYSCMPPVENLKGRGKKTEITEFQLPFLVLFFLD